MSLTRPVVLILSTNPVFAREQAGYWPPDRNPPEFTVLKQDLFRDLAGCHYDLAIADAASPESHSELKQCLAAAGKPAIIVHCDHDRPLLTTDGVAIELRAEDGVWPAIAGILAREILRRSSAEARACDADTACAAAQAEATLGRYMVEMRHNVNNALTTVLGNAELIMLESGLPADVVTQADTIRNMALRLHEIFKRFSSIEKELSVAARESGKQSVSHRAGSVM